MPPAKQAAKAKAAERAAVRWTTRIVPVVLAGLVGYATYDAVSHLIIDYLYREKHETGTAIALLVLYCFFLVLSLATYCRTIIIIHTDTGLVPLPDPGPHHSSSHPAADHALSPREKRQERRRSEAGAGHGDGDGFGRGQTRHERRRRRQQRDLEAQPYSQDPNNRGWGPDPDPDSPGLEQFYTREVFVCEGDGRPRWCSSCHNWKPDRAHHSSEIGRCVRKMDHYCPWVGGMVSETSFKFFVQFTSYCSAYCAVVLGTAAYCLARKLQDGDGVDAQAVAILAIAAFFGMFVSTLGGSSLRYVFLNVTNIDMLKRPQVYQLAVRVPNGTVPANQFNVVTYPLPSRAPPPQPPPPPVAAAAAAAAGQPHPAAAKEESPRDQLAQHTFAVLRTEPDENPWDLGPWRNFKAVMGSNIVDWLLPLRMSPCAFHDPGTPGDYEFGPLIDKLRDRNGISRLDEHRRRGPRRASTNYRRCDGGDAGGR